MHYSDISEGLRPSEAIPPVIDMPTIAHRVFVRIANSNAPMAGRRPSVKKKFQCTPYSVTCSYHDRSRQLVLNRASDLRGNPTPSPLIPGERPAEELAQLSAEL